MARGNTKKLRIYTERTIKNALNDKHKQKNKK